MDNRGDTRAKSVSTDHYLSRPFGGQLEPKCDLCAKNYPGKGPAAFLHFLAGLYPTADSRIKSILG